MTRHLLAIALIVCGVCLAAFILRSRSDERRA